MSMASRLGLLADGRLPSHGEGRRTILAHVVHPIGQALREHVIGLPIEQRLPTLPSLPSRPWTQKEVAARAWQRSPGSLAHGLGATRACTQREPAAAARAARRPLPSHSALSEVPPARILRRCRGPSRLRRRLGCCLRLLELCLCLCLGFCSLPLPPAAASPPPQPQATRHVAPFQLHCFCLARLPAAADPPRALSPCTHVVARRGKGAQIAPPDAPYAALPRALPRPAARRRVVTSRAAVRARGGQARWQEREALSLCEQRVEGLRCHIHEVCDVAASRAEGSTSSAVGCDPRCDPRAASATMLMSARPHRRACEGRCELRDSPPAELSSAARVSKCGTMAR